MEIGLVRSIDIDQEMQQAYLDYAMSVIVSRALPDARDGLKPVHRRILYAMYEIGLRPDTPYKKSARIVGEVLGKYHPHGDMAVYEAMARMAQDFSMRYLLVDGQGNFGSVDGDPPAAMRYTEARLAAPAMQMLTDIEKDTVDFLSNFDDTLKEPSVLPAAFPNLLVNGATGIAVGMSTSIPPHNLGEVVDALCYLLVNWDKMDDITIADLMKFIQGPDFPTGGIILASGGEDSLASAYGSGRGQVTVQARAHLEEMERGRSRIIITELPYMVNKSALIERIAELVREEKLTGIADLRDESDQRGMRIVIEVSKNSEAETVLGELYKHTPMQSTFSIIMLALVDGEPRLLSLKQALRVYLDHRITITRRRSEYELRRARERAHILEGLRIALKNLDEVIELIRKSADTETARQKLMKRFKLSELQATAILDMPLKRLAALERKKIEEEYKELLAKIKDLESLLKSAKKIRQVAADELQAVKAAFGDRRRTQIASISQKKGQTTLLTAADLAPQGDVWIALSPQGKISRMLGDKTPRLSGNEAARWLIKAQGKDVLYIVLNDGECAALPVHTIPEVARISDGSYLSSISPVIETEKIATIFVLPPKNERPSGWFVLTLTQQGYIKKSKLDELGGAAAHLFPLAKVNPGDLLIDVLFTHADQEILLATKKGMAIRFKEEGVRPMGLSAAGVLGIKLDEEDQVIGGIVLPVTGQILMVAANGFAKRLALEQFPQQGRYGQGVQAWKLPQQVTLVGVAVGKENSQGTLFLEKLAPKSIRFDEAPLQSRTGRGRPIQELKGSDKIVRLVVPREYDWSSSSSKRLSRTKTKAKKE
ncbi:MAG: DNA gyrase subunit A [Anaerolineales bacterium]